MSDSKTALQFTLDGIKTTSYIMKQSHLTPVDIG